MSERRPSRGALKLADDAARTDEARRRLLADWCRLVGTRVNGPTGTMADAAEAARAAGKPASPAVELNSAGQTLSIDSAPPTGNTVDAVEASVAALGLPRRVAQVLMQLLAGASEKQIAVRLAISPHTVHTYVKQLHKRLNVASRGELLARFVGPIAPR